jgi:DNA polymerase I
MDFLPTFAELGSASAANARRAIAQAVQAGAVVHWGGVDGLHLTGASMVPDAQALLRQDLLAQLPEIGAEDAQRTRALLSDFAPAGYLYIQDPESAALAVAQMLSEANIFSIDLETRSRPEHHKPRPPILINQDGTLRTNQPWSKWKPATALCPVRGQVRLSQWWDGVHTVRIFDHASVPLEVLQPLLDRIDQQGGALVGHNLAFDLAFLHAAGLKLPVASLDPDLPRAVTYHDTMLAAGLFSPTNRPGLAQATKQWLKVELPKSAQIADYSRAELTAAQLDYAVLDAVVAYSLHDALQRRLQALSGELESRFQRCYHLACGAIAPSSEVGANGVLLDQDHHQALVDEWDAAITKLTSEIRPLTGMNKVNPVTKEFDEWMRNQLPAALLAEWPRTEKGRLTKTAAAFTAYSDAHPAMPLLAALVGPLNIRQAFGGKLVEAAQAAPDGRIRAPLNIAAAKTGRFSSGGGVDRINFQNMPKRKSKALRCSFIAPPGRVLVCADYSMMELRILAAVSRDEAMLTALAAGDDLHALTASRWFGAPVCEVTEQQRNAAKGINFGTCYGAQAPGLREFVASYGVTISLEQAEQARCAFFTLYPGVAEYQRRWIGMCKRHRAVKTVGGRVHYFRWEDGGKFSEPLAVNFPIQGTGAEIAQRALARIHGALRKLPGTPLVVAQVHDEFVIEVDADAADAAGDCLRTEMLAAAIDLLPDYPQRDGVDVSLGDSWGDMCKLQGP